MTYSKTRATKDNTAEYLHVPSQDAFVAQMEELTITPSAPAKAYYAIDLRLLNMSTQMHVYHASKPCEGKMVPVNAVISSLKPRWQRLVGEKLTKPN
jgi:hypothetical protein